MLAYFLCCHGRQYEQHLDPEMCNCKLDSNCQQVFTKVDTNNGVLCCAGMFWCRYHRYCAGEPDLTNSAASEFIIQFLVYSRAFLDDFIIFIVTIQVQFSGS